MMSNEEFDRKMEFIVNQQAQFAAGMQRLEEAQTFTDQSVARTAEIVARTAEVVAHLANVTHENFDVTLEGFKNGNTKIDALADSQRLTDESLRNLIATVDRYLSEGHNGA